MTFCALLLVFAILLDRLLGDPPYPWHPVRLIGRSIQWLEPLFRRRGIQGVWGGTAFVLSLLLFWLGFIALLTHAAFIFKPVGFLFSLYILYSCIAHQDLAAHVRPVVSALERGEIDESRVALQKIVGRDTQVLDETGIIRATIETIAEGFVDGFLSPIFFFSVFSLAGLAFHAPCLSGVMGVFGYRIINTLDSMIGYKNERYLYFGRFAARLDDVANFVPARLSILFLFLSAWLLKLDAAGGVDATWRYRLCAASPNAGYPESFVAGALGIRIGGPVQYPFGKVTKPFIGEGHAPLTVETVRQTTRLILRAGYLAGGMSALFLWASPHLTPLFRF